MEYITFNNGNKMPLLGFGTYKVTGDNNGEEIVKTALDAGYRLLDTAAYYDNEEEVGRGIKISGVPREEIFLTTKVWYSDFEGGACEKSVMSSLQKLDTDYLDLVLLHWPYGNIYSAWRDLEKLYKKGIIKNIGVSNFDLVRLMDLITFNEVVPCVNQIEAHLYCQRKEYRKWQDKYKVATQAYGPLGRGKLNEMFSLPELKEIAQNHRKTTSQVMLRFLTQIGISVIPKSSRKERLEENFNIFDFSLDEKEMETLIALDKDLAIEGLSENPEKFEAMKERI